MPDERPDDDEERVSLHGQDFEQVVGALLRTKPVRDPRVTEEPAPPLSPEAQAEVEELRKAAENGTLKSHRETLADEYKRAGLDE